MKSKKVRNKHDKNEKKNALTKQVNTKTSPSPHIISLIPTLSSKA